MKVDAVIQARMGSTRLPNKMLYTLNGKPVIEWVVERTRRATLVDRLVLATTTHKEDDLLEAEARRLDLEVFRGEEQDVLARFNGATAGSTATHVVRVCADNPLIWGPEIDNLIRHAISHPCDYAYNHVPKGNSYPDGIGAEIVPLHILRILHEKAVKPEHREHIFSYIWDHPASFRICTFDPPDEAIHQPDLRFDLDTFEDFRYLAGLEPGIGESPRDIIERIKKGRGR